MGTSIQLVADEYFNSLNPIAVRISIDVTSTKEAYEHVWNTLSYSEQRQVIDETIIHPEAVLKYAFERSLEKPEISPTLDLQSDGKFILDDDCIKTIQWRDEHSAPFSWLTQSQINLSQVTSPFRVATRLPPFRANVPPVSTGNTTEAFVDDPHVVLGGSAGSTAKLASVIGSKLKLTPVSAPKHNGTTNDTTVQDTPSTGLLSKLKNKTAILRIPASLKGVTSPKSDSSSRNKTDKSDKVSLVQKRNVINVAPAKSAKNPAPQPPVLKPKGPPPPPPTQNSKAADRDDQSNIDVEKVALLGDSWSSELSAAQSSTLKSTAESLVLATDSTSEMEICSSTTTMLSPYDTSPRQTDPEFMQFVSESGSIPKTGFEFLDNW